MTKPKKSDSAATVVGQNIRRLRKARNWTQEFLATESGVERTTIIRAEQGTSFRPSTTTLEKLARALGCHITALYAENEARS